MPKATDIRIKSAVCSFEPVSFRVPLKFGGRVMDRFLLINVDVVVECRDGKRRASGLGSMPLGHLWAWPSATVPPDQTEAAMKLFVEESVELANDCPEFGHPIDLIYHLSAEYEHLGKQIASRLKLPETMPLLAELVAASPLDAAVHDAYGRALELNSYNTLSSKFMNFDLSEYLDASFKGEYLDQYTLRDPKPRMPLYHLVGALDALTDADIIQKANDGLPETLEQWIPYNGLTHFKIKLAGDNFEWDTQRVLAVESVTTAAQAKRGCPQWWYSLDFNEKCENAQYVVQLLKKIQSDSPSAYDRIQYIEQPTHRDLKGHPDQVMHEAAKLKPVVIDESLVDYDALLLCREMGYSGVALKACKGQTEALLMGAAAQKFGMFLCVQDLTCPGYSFLHSASLAARIPSIAAIEGNGRQFCPSGNKLFVKSFPGMFDIKDGTVETGLLTGNGLGF
ncbi:MAG: mandelate racemase/muconate lactonizing enzyme family protein [Planctomycetaceae bacterium]|nr:mandelate racemase/muconate lactonizing enzyme family protein [Planctomycetaceae bacterium]